MARNSKKEQTANKIDLGELQQTLENAAAHRNQCKLLLKEAQEAYEIACEARKHAEIAFANAASTVLESLDLRA